MSTNHTTTPYIPISVLTFNTIIYLLAFAFSIKHKEHSYFKIRSPLLLMLNNLGGFLMTTCFLLYELLYSIQYSKSIINTNPNNSIFCHILPNNYFIFHSLMYISFILRAFRLIKCTNLENEPDIDNTNTNTKKLNETQDAKNKIKNFKNIRYKYTEIYYIKALSISMFIIIVLVLIINFALSDYSIRPYNQQMCFNPNLIDSISGYLSFLWVILNFFEDIILITYSYWILTCNLKLMIKFELILFTAIWIIYPNTVRLIEKPIFNNSNENLTLVSYICCIFLWLCLFINAYVPWICAKMSIFDDTFYPLPSSEISNFYLFLSNEESCYAFYKYLSSHPESLIRKKSITALRLYTDLIRFRLFFTIETDYFVVLSEAKKIYKKYFDYKNSMNITSTNSKGNINNPNNQGKPSNPNNLNKPGNPKNVSEALDLKEDVLNLIDEEAFFRLEVKSKMLTRDEVCIGHYDEVLAVMYNYLKQHFEYFKSTNEYKYQKKIAYYRSFVQCLLTNIGMMNKY